MNVTISEPAIAHPGDSLLAESGTDCSGASLAAFSSGFYGRIVPLKHLDNIRFRVLEQQAELVLVRGISGVGKTSLVREFIKDIPEGQFLVGSGKFDQYNRTVPYSGLVNALQSLLVRILAGGEGDVDVWRLRLSQALGENAALVIDLIPELERLIGRQQPVANLAPEESHNRFSLLFQRVIQALCRPERPLLLFLDDLQWVDSSTLEILVRLLSFTHSGGLMIVGSYRDNEVGQGHPLCQFERQIRGLGKMVHEIALAPLSSATIEQLLSDSFGCPPVKTLPFVEFVWTRTGGNPFFIHQLLAVIRQSGLLIYDEQRGEWQWDLDDIDNRVPAENVDELLLSLLASCSEMSREFIGLASYLGNTFSLDLLARAAGEDGGKVKKSLAPLVRLRLILLEGSHDTMAEDRAEYYRFSHDRVQQAAYALIPEEKRLPLHLSLGRRLLPFAESAVSSEIFFQVADQFRLASSLIDNHDESLAGCRLLMAAGQKAYKAASYQLAYDYLHSAISLLPSNSWAEFYDLSLDLHYTLAEAAYLLRDFWAMEKSLAQVMAHAGNGLDKSRVFELRAQACIVRSEMREAIDVILAGLSELGVQLNPHPGALETLRALLTMRTALFRFAAVRAVRQPVMTDPEYLVVMRLLSKLLSAAYMHRPALLPVAVAALIRFSRRHGAAPETAAAYGAAGILFCGVVGDINTGCRAGELSLEILARYQLKAMMSQVYFYNTAFMAHWKKPIWGLADVMGQAYHYGIASGDFEYAAFSIFMASYFRFFGGEQLSKTKVRMADNSKSLHELQQSAPLQMHEVYRQMVENLRAQGGDPWQFTGEVLDEESFIAKSGEDRSSLCHLHFAKLMMAYWFGEYNLALDQGEKTEALLDSLTATYNVPLFHFYQALTLLALGPKKVGQGTWRWRRRVKRSMKKLRRWARHCPENYSSKYSLVKAEWQRCQGRKKEAGRAFDYAIKEAILHGLVHEEGLAHEVAARFYLEQGQHDLAQSHIQEAYSRFKRWGAQRKLYDLHHQYADFFTGARLHIL